MSNPKLHWHPYADQIKAAAAMADKEEETLLG
jgi:hypothetical protein